MKAYASTHSCGIGIDQEPMLPASPNLYLHHIVRLNTLDCKLKHLSLTLGRLDTQNY